MKIPTALVLLMVSGCGLDVPAEDDTHAATSDEVATRTVTGYNMTVEPWREVAPPPVAAEAVAIVMAYYGTVGRPQIHWYGGDGLDDPGGVGWCITGSDPQRCVGGLEGGGVVLVATAPWMKISDGGLAHELGHMRAWERSAGDDDPGHLMTGIFGPGGEVYRANQVLAAAGL